jgi:cytochrome c biogenesis protein CcmG, thiol:disulfide interchange protein DsbE
VRSRRLVVLAVAVALVACASDDRGTPVVGPGAVDPRQAPDVRVDTTLDLSAVGADAQVPARTVTLEQASWPEVAAWIRREAETGRPVVVNFFASYCAPCVRELPLLLDAADAHGDVTFLGVHTAERVARGAEMVDRFGIDLPTFTDPDADVLAEVGGRVLPYTVAFDRDAHLAGRVFGELTEASLAALLTEARRVGHPLPDASP